MLKTLTGVALAGVLAVGAVTASSQQAEARCYGCAVGAGVVGGLVAGALIGGAIANAQPAPPPVYYAPAPRTCLVEEQVWSNRYQAWVTRPVRVAC